MSDNLLKQLVCELKNEKDEFIDFSLEKNNLKILDRLMSFDSNKLFLALSSPYLDENLDIFLEAENPTCLKAIISLPIFENEDNISLVILDADKTSHEFILIDESDCLVNEGVDSWKYIKNNIVDAYKCFKSTSTSAIVNINDFNKKNSSNLNNDEFSEFLSLKKSVKSNNSKKRVLTDQLSGDITRKLNDDSYNMNAANGLGELIYNKKRQNPENLLYKNEKRILNEEVVFLNLQYLADIRAIDNKNDCDSILIKSDKTSKDLIFYNDEVEDFNEEVFIELSNFHYDLSKEYLYYYLKSDTGLDEIFYFSKSTRFIKSVHLKDVKIPLPSLETQEKIVKTLNESRDFFHDVELLKKQFQSNILDYMSIQKSLDDLKGNIEFKNSSSIENMQRSRIHAYKGLIWPLAISYLYATKGSFETVEKLDNYLTLFEFIAAFNAVILLSGLPDEVYKENFDDIWDMGVDYYKKDMTFGNWLFLCKNTWKVYSKNNFQTDIDENLIKTISSKKITDLLFKVSRIRNEKHHGPFMNKKQAQNTLDWLEPKIEYIFDILDVYSDYKLIYSTSDVNIEDNWQRVILLNGPCNQPIYERMYFDEFLKPNRLYLYNPKNNKKLLIKDSLMKFKSTDEFEKHWAIFIYNSCDRDGIYANYKCFQSNEKYREEIYDFKTDILE